ncbi:hypothetical protein H7347_05390 [Corynebacterium sp. zg-331]|uniref:hypothetical protein n=1 Tax=unclassified Corynebacterium TaxID=2624378 RepID=UPI00128D977B|nr:MULTISPECIES: hypothetical protein [unclassified Corynebacterium]MBC3186011.1 hypothetical protein [Corynebacterium sp. zg-331]MPV52502.1 hypothetical protein [Corynebacterium sp. zg331]
MKRTLRTTPAVVLLLALAAWYGGRLIAAIGWRGEYLPRWNMVADLQVSECLPMEDFFAPRVACSPHYLWFQCAGLFAAVMVAVAGLWLLQRGHGMAGAAPMGGGFITAGICAALALAVDPAHYSTAHYVLEAVAVAAMWCVMAVAGVTSRRQRAIIEEVPRAAAGGPLIPVTWVLLGVSVLGAALTTAAALGTGYGHPVGLYQRMAIDAPALWLLALASGWWRR